ncbi:DUF2202 domain-containing protein [Hydrogenimonas sp.]
MKRKSAITLTLAAVTASILAGCGGSSDTTTATTYDITVERGPVLHAVVIDGDGRRATESGNGRYSFTEVPVHPIYAAGGFIDLDRDGVVSAGDINNTLLLLAPEGEAATVVSTVALQSEIRTWLKEQFGLSDEQIDNATPDTDRTIAAVSDEIYAYCIENNMTDPSRLTIQQMEMIQSAVAARIQAYLDSNESTEILEEQLVDALQIPRLSDEDIALVESSGTGMGGIIDAVAALPEYNLTEAQKYTLAYMWNEEKMAKDLYLAMNETSPHQTLYNIATRAETQHEAAVEALVQKYDINITNLETYEMSYSEEELRALAPGQFSVPEVQALYDTLYAKGSQSLQDALEVGCMVEVTDVADLDTDLETAGDAMDLVMVFSNLRNGSYNHYWAFDRALKALGVTDGCCSLGEEYCKTAEEFPAQQGGMGHMAQ